MLPLARPLLPPSMRCSDSPATWRFNLRNARKNKHPRACCPQVPCPAEGALAPALVRKRWWGPLRAEGGLGQVGPGCVLWCHLPPPEAQGRKADMAAWDSGPRRSVPHPHPGPLSPRPPSWEIRAPCWVGGGLSGAGRGGGWAEGPGLQTLRAACSGSQRLPWWSSSCLVPMHPRGPSPDRDQTRNPRTCP